MIFHVTCSTDDNYIQHCMAMLCSLYDNNIKHDITVHLLHHGLSVDNQQLLINLSTRYTNKIFFYDIDLSQFDGVELNPNHTWLSMATYYRFLISKCVPSYVDRILYLDCDVIVLEDVSSLFLLQIEEFGVAAVRDCTPFDLKHRNVMGLELDDKTFCAGVMIINLKYWRDHNCQKKLFDYARKQRENLIMEDQDVLNYVFRKKWFQLPYKYGKTPLSYAPIDNVQRWFDITEYVNQPSIYHYAAFAKPWLNVWFPDRKFYWKYVKISEYPNPVVTKANGKQKIRIYKTLTRYLINRYIRPFVPDFIEMIIKDIVYILLFLINIIRPSRFRYLKLSRWFGKYNK